MVAVLAGAVAAQEPDTPARPLQVELVAGHAALRPGEVARIGVRLRHAPHWHSYWINPGDSGLPTRLAWTLPQGYAAGGVDWPLPQRFAVGHLQNFGYEGEIVLPLSLSVPADAKPGSRVRLATTVKWLACREECIPGKDELELELPIATDAGAIDPRWSALFSAAQRAQPQPQPVAWQGSAELVGERVRVVVQGTDLPAPQGLDAFAVQRKLLGNQPPSFRREGDSLVIETNVSEYFTTAPERFDLVLTAPGADARRGWKLTLPLHEPATAGQPPP
jgi:thiol:disulfide interchange protein DsbD